MLQTTLGILSTVTLAYLSAIGRSHFLCPFQSHVSDNEKDHEESIPEAPSAVFVTLTFHCRSSVKGI